MPAPAPARHTPARLEGSTAEQPPAGEGDSRGEGIWQAGQLSVCAWHPTLSSLSQRFLVFDQTPTLVPRSAHASSHLEGHPGMLPAPSSVLASLPGRAQKPHWSMCEISKIEEQQMCICFTFWLPQLHETKICRVAQKGNHHSCRSSWCCWSKKVNVAWMQTQLVSFWCH